MISHSELDIRSVRLIDVTPSSIADNAEVRAASAAIDAGFFSVIDDMRQIIILPIIDELPEHLVDALAVMRKVDFYDQTLPLETKRLLVKKSIDWKTRTGTPSVIEELVNEVFTYAEVLENWAYGGQPFHFKVVIQDKNFDPAKVAQLIKAIHAYKAVHAVFDGIDRFANILHKMFFGVAMGRNRRQVIQFTHPQVVKEE